MYLMILGCHFIASINGNSYELDLKFQTDTIPNNDLINYILTPLHKPNNNFSII